MSMTYFRDPTPHIILDPLIDDATYKRAKFPDLPKRPGGRIGRDLYVHEEGYEELTQSPGWKQIHDKVTSDAFVRQVLTLFADDLKRFDCLVEPTKMRMEQYGETRVETETSPLSTDYDPNALFNRFDFQATDALYGKGIHVDWPRRIVGGVLFFCDAGEEKMKGGSFALFEDEKFQNDRVCHQPKLAKEFVPKHNFGVLFLNCNTGFHGPTKIESIDGLRKWIYYSISSRRDVWPWQVTIAKTGHHETKYVVPAGAH